MNLTETWLDSTIKDVVEIEGYNIFRGDRKKREGESQDREGVFIIPRHISYMSLEL